MREKTYDAIGYVVTALFLGALALIDLPHRGLPDFLHWVKPASGR